MKSAIIKRWKSIIPKKANKPFNIRYVKISITQEEIDADLFWK